METIIEKIKKIKELADRGYQGEAIAAKHKLELLLAKYNLSIHDIEDNELKMRHIKYKDAWNKKLVLQTVASCTERELSFYRNSYYPGHILVELSDLEYVEVLNKLDFHRKQFEKEKRKAEKAFFTAYIHQHELFGNGGGKGGKKLTLEEMMAIWGMMENLEKVSYHKSLPK